jgi:hypothetical protein
MTEHDSFVLGATAFCKDAGFDVDDTTQVVRLLLMDPIKAMPIVKRASMAKSAALNKQSWEWWDNWVGNQKAFWNDPFGSKKRTAREHGRTQMKLHGQNQAEIAQQKLDHPDDPSKWVGRTDEDFTDRSDANRQSLISAGHDLDVDARGGVFGDTPAPEVNTTHEANTAGMTTEQKQEYNKKRNLKQQALARKPMLDIHKRLGWASGNVDVASQLGQASGDLGEATRARRAMERKLRVGNLMKVDVNNLTAVQAPFKDQILSMQKSFRVPNTGAQNVAAGTPTGTTRDVGAGAEGGTGGQNVATGGEQVSSSPPVDTGGGRNVPSGVTDALDKAVGVNPDYQPGGGDFTDAAKSVWGEEGSPKEQHDRRVAAASGGNQLAANEQKYDKSWQASQNRMKRPSSSPSVDVAKTKGVHPAQAAAKKKKPTWGQIARGREAGLRERGAVSTARGSFDGGAEQAASSTWGPSGAQPKSVHPAQTAGAATPKPKPTTGMGWGSGGVDLKDSRLAGLNKSMRGQSGSISFPIKGGGTYTSNDETARPS